MKYLYLTPLLFLAACSGRDVITTAHDFEVKLNGSDAAYCTISTPDNRYSLRAPGSTLVERDDEDLKVDCKDNNSDRRRTVKVQSDFALGYWTYPESVTIDFASKATTAIDNGYRLTPMEKNVREVLTEDSYSAPIDETPKLNMHMHETMIEQEIIIQDSAPVNLNMTQEMSNLESIEYEALNAMANDVKTMPAPRQYNGRRSYPITLD